MKWKKQRAPNGGLQICPSSVELTSVRNMNTEMKRTRIVSGMKWTLPKNKGDPQWDTSETQAHSGQQNEQWGSNPKRKKMSQNASKATLRTQAPSKTSP